MFKFIYNILTFGMFGKFEKLNEQTIIHGESIRNNNIELINKIEELGKTIEETIEEKMEEIDIEEKVGDYMSNNFCISDYSGVEEGEYPLDEIDNKTDKDDVINIVEETFGIEQK
tara:strand:- start:746 stop:1090 length:345 start_codon:yes stop_codon:yes gene_type:complete